MISIPITGRLKVEALDPGDKFPLHLTMEITLQNGNSVEFLPPVLVSHFLHRLGQSEIDLAVKEANESLGEEEVSE